VDLRGEPRALTTDVSERCTAIDFGPGEERCCNLLETAWTRFRRASVSIMLLGCPVTLKQDMSSARSHTSLMVEYFRSLDHDDVRLVG